MDPNCRKMYPNCVPPPPARGRAPDATTTRAALDHPCKRQRDRTLAVALVPELERAQPASRPGAARDDGLEARTAPIKPTLKCWPIES
jgi:hypothetical protein